MGVVASEPDRRVTLGARTLIGRSRTCAISVSSGQVSGEHACILWHAGRWCVRDLGSTNGTWVDRRRLEPGERRQLDRGTSMSFGTLDGGPLWALVDDAPPAVRAVCRGARETISGEDLVQLGDASRPGWTIFHDGARWIAEREGAQRAIGDHETLEHDGREWVIELPPVAAGDPIDSTDSAGPRSLPIELYTFRFDVSLDEEAVTLSLLRHADENQVVDLGTRSFHYLLVTLARKRLEDRAAGATPAEEGWIHSDELARMLATTKPRINVEVFRARELVAAHGIAGAGRIVERRPTSGQIRLGIDRLRVVDGRSAPTGRRSS